MKSAKLLLVILALTACGDDDPCPAGEVRIGDTCLGSADAGPDVTIAETCNGLDDDFDGATDEADPMLGESCGNEVGVCTLGLTVCSGGELVCDAVVASDETCNGLDDDCDGVIDEDSLQDFYLDRDGDGYGSGDACTACGPNECGDGTWVTMDGDCDETCDTCFTGATEVCDELDNDCDTVVDNDVLTPVYEDEDGDGYGTGPEMLRCLDDEGNAPEGLAVENGDCGPDDDRAFPGANGSYSTEIVGRVPSSLFFDFDCDGAESQTLPECGLEDGTLIPVCAVLLGPSYCWIYNTGVPPCGESGFHRPTQGSRDVDGVAECEFTGLTEARDFECR